MSNTFSDLKVNRASQKWLFIFILDTSGSMDQQRNEGEPAPIAQLNNALREWMQNKLFPDNRTALACGELAIITFEGYDARLLRADDSGRFSPTAKSGDTWLPVAGILPFAEDLKAEGFTPLWKAIDLAIDTDRQRKTEHSATGNEVIARTMLYIVTDGMNSDANGNPNKDMPEYVKAVARLANAKESRSIEVYGLGVKPHDSVALNELSSPGKYFDLESDLSKMVEILNRSVNENARQIGSSSDSPFSRYKTN